MAIAMFMEWPGVTAEQYETVMVELDLDQNPADGAVFHVASLTPEGLRVLDIWETSQDFDAFSAARLTPAVKTAGIESQPKIEILAVHNVYAPGLDVLSEMGSISLPDSAADEEDDEDDDEPVSEAAEVKA